MDHPVALLAKSPEILPLTDTTRHSGLLPKGAHKGWIDRRIGCRVSHILALERVKCLEKYKKMPLEKG